MSNHVYTEVVEGEGYLIILDDDQIEAPNGFQKAVSEREVSSMILSSSLPSLKDHEAQEEIPRPRTPG